MAERSDAPDPGAEAPSGLPEDVTEHEPLGTEDADPEGEGDTPRGEDAQPGMNRGEPDVSG